VHSQYRRWIIRVGGNHGRPTLSVRSTPNSDRKLKGLASVTRLGDIGGFTLRRWMSTTTTALVAPPVNGAGIDPIQIIVGSPNLPTEHFVDYSFVYPSN
jgi:hypothetical protein